MAGAGYRDWTAGETPTAATFDNYLQEQTVMTFATEAARDLALAAVKSDGMIADTRDKNRVWRYNGTTWELIAGSMPRVRAAKTATQSLAAGGSPTAVTFPASEEYDTDSLHDTSTNPSRITIPASLGGVWTVQYSLYVPASVAGELQAFLLLNGSTAVRYGWSTLSLNGSGVEGVLEGSCDVVLPVGTGGYAELFAYHTNGSSAARNFGGAGSFLTATYRCPA